jgi:hypothetical protein
MTRRPALATPLAAGTPAQAMLAKVAEARTRQQAARDQVLALVKTDTARCRGAAQQGETPAWREMRTGLLEAGKLARAGCRRRATAPGRHPTSSVCWPWRPRCGPGAGRWSSPG